ncbi:unnamed protein product [Schistosoma curassoni]|uniref:Uncharacterized protein n=1 Tax=Schistosoma curassoni TaxID=6186 RepID=A0A183L2Z1_9TREM|nr:unnamed protein product [Schistosoma curassoni]
MHNSDRPSRKIFKVAYDIIVGGPTICNEIISNKRSASYHRISLPTSLMA